MLRAGDSSQSSHRGHLGCGHRSAGLRLPWLWLPVSVPSLAGHTPSGFLRLCCVFPQGGSLLFLPGAARAPQWVPACLEFTSEQVRSAQRPRAQPGWCCRGPFTPCPHFSKMIFFRCKGSFSVNFLFLLWLVLQMDPRAFILSCYITSPFYFETGSC